MPGLLTSGGLERAKIVVQDDDAGETGIDEIPCLFNPTTLQVKYTAEFHIEPKAGTEKSETPDTAKIDYIGPGAKGLSVELLFDSTEDWDHAGIKAGDSVKTLFVDKLLILMKPIEKTGDGGQIQKKPALCTFRWGDLTKFEDADEWYYLESIDVTYQLFDDKGTPLRAKVGLSMTKELMKAKKQNPTTVGVGRKLWQVEAGQSLSWIAYKEYGDPNEWRRIADANNITNPRQLRPGQFLRLPPRT